MSIESFVFLASHTPANIKHFILFLIYPIWFWYSSFYFKYETTWTCFIVHVLKLQISQMSSLSPVHNNYFPSTRMIQKNTMRYRNKHISIYFIKSDWYIWYLKLFKSGGWLYPSEKWWSESQLGLWNSQLNGKSIQIPWFQSPPTSIHSYWSHGPVEIVDFPVENCHFIISIIWVCLKMAYTPNYSHLKTG